MKKEREDDHTAVYRVEVGVPGDEYPSRSGKQRFKTKTERGRFVYDKAGGELRFAEGSAPLYAGNEHVRTRCQWKMRKCQQEGEFPEVVTWAA